MWDTTESSPSAPNQRRPRSAATFLAVLLTAALVLPANGAGQAVPLSADDARDDFAHVARSGGFWVTSNEAYWTTDSGEPTEYRMRFTLAPDGFSMSGCMWGATASEETAPFWRFFSAWDPTTESVLVYQSSPGGAVAIGRERGWADGGTEAIQTLQTPDGQRSLVRHLSVKVHRDTLDSRSYDANDSPNTDDVEWTPRRSYVWTWRPSASASPC